MNLPSLSMSYNICDLIQYVTFYVCLLLLGIMVLRFNHVVASVSNSFFFWLNNIPLYVYAKLSLLIYPSNGHLDCFHLLAFVSSAARNICVQIFV